MRVGTRRIVLVVAVLGVAGAVGGLYLHRERGRDAAARVARAEGLAAFDRREFALAAARLREFVKRPSPDALALRRFGQSIGELQGAGSQDLEEAILALRRSVALEQDCVEARRDLLDLLRRLGMRTEAIEQANWLLARDPGDAAAFRAKVASMVEMGLFSEVVTLLDARIQPESPRLEEQLLYVELLARLKTPSEKILARAARVEAANASDPRFRLVGARARIVTDDAAGAREALESLAKSAGSDEPFVRLLVPSLDAVGLSRLSLQLIESLDSERLEPDQRVDLVRRLWEAGAASAVPERIGRWKLAPDALPTPIVAFDVMALCRLRRVDAAKPLLDVLRSRSQDPIAVGWARLLAGVFVAEAPTVGERITASLAAIEADPVNPQSRRELGLAYRDAGELELAVRELRTAASLAPNWAEPAALGARILADGGRLQAAVSAAADAERRGSEDPGVALLTSMARGAVEGVAGRTLPERVLQGLERTGRSAGETLPIRLALAAASKQPGTAKALIEEALESDAKPDGEVLLACALLSRREGLGLEARCTSSYERLHGSTPALALALGRQAAALGDADAGLELLRARRAVAKDKESSAWCAAEAAFLEAHGTTGEALVAWKAAARVSGEDPARLRAILGADSTWQDRDLIRATIDRLSACTGASGLWWRYYDARWRLSAGEANPEQTSVAIAELGRVLEIAPELVPARLLLATAYEGLGEAQKALDQLIVARRDGRSTVALDLAMVRLQLKVGDSSAARDLLGRLLAQDAVPTRRLSEAQKLVVASLYARLGERKSVLDLLGRLDPSPADSDELRARAELYGAVGELDMAERMIGSQPEQDRDSPRSLLLAAALADAEGRTGDEETLLARLGAVVPDPLERERMVGDHFLQAQSFARAEEALRRAVALEGAEGGDWSRLLACQVLLGKADAIPETLHLARSHGWFGARDGNGGLSAEVLRIAVGRPELRALGAAYVQSAGQRAVAEKALRLLEAAERSELSTSEESGLRALAEGNPKFLELQLAWVEFLFRHKRYDDAILVLRAAAGAFPSAPDPLRGMAFCYRAMGRADLAADAAGEWRARSRGHSLPADLFLAEQSSPDRAVALLEPHLPQALERGLRGVLMEFGRALILQGDYGRLEAALGPHLARGRVVAQAWIELAGLGARRGEPARATTWLNREEVAAAAAVDPHARVELAVAWQFVASATGSDEARQKSRAFATSLRTGEDLSGKAWERLGQVNEANQDLDRAEAAYRRAVAAEPPPLVAMNNLAMILARSGRAKEAQGLADRLVGLRPDLPDYGDTRAFVYLQLGDRPAAVKQYAENRRADPRNAEWPVRMIEVLLDEGDREGAAKAARVVLEQYPEDKMSPAVRVRWDGVAGKLGLPAGPGRK